MLRLRATPLPIAVRELRVASRKSQTYWGRLIPAILGLVMCLVGLWAVLFLGATQRDGRQLFQMLSFIWYSLCVMAGMAAADLIVSEKRDGTLGLLFLTHLKGWDIGLGKLAPAFLMAMYGLLATLPVLMIPVLLGGVTFAEFFRMSLALLTITLSSLAFGLAVSTISKDVSKATGAIGLLMPLWAFAMPDLLVHSPIGKKAPEFVQIVILFAPRHLMNLSSSAVFTNMFWVAWMAQMAVTVLLIATACVLLPRCWQEKTAGAPDKGWRRQYHLWRFGSPTFRAAFRRRLFAINPIFWLRARPRVLGAAVFILLLGGLALWLGRWHWNVPVSKAPMQALLTFGVGWAFVTPIFAICTLAVLSSLGQMVAEDRRTGALELIAATRLTVPEILRGHFLAGIRRSAPYVLATLLGGSLAAIWFFEMSRTAENLPGTFFEHLAGGLETLKTNVYPDAPQFFAVVLCGLIVLYPLLCCTMAWAAVWSGMRVKKVANASGQAFFLVMALPWLANMFMVALLVYGSKFGWWTLPETPIFQIVLGWTLAMINSILVIYFTRRSLLQNFRIWAADRYDPPPPPNIFIRAWTALQKSQRKPAPIAAGQ